jgi:hypothetical protein
MRIVIIALMLALAGSAIVSASDIELVIVNPSKNPVEIRVTGYKHGVPWTDSKSVSNGRIRWDVEGIAILKIYGRTQSGDQCSNRNAEGGTWYVITHEYGSHKTYCELSRFEP